MTLGEAVSIFESQHGNPATWTPQEWVWHDVLIRKLQTELAARKGDADGSRR